MEDGNGDRQEQRLYREVNKCIREAAAKVQTEQAVEFLCECGQPECKATIELTETQWDSLINGGETVLLVAEHAGAADGRRVIAENKRFVLAALA
jgi:hypothetical protein